MKKPEKVSWLTYYVGWPIRDFINTLSEAVEKARIKFMGGWYCEYCHKVHGRRVYRYKLLFLNINNGVTVSDAHGRRVYRYKNNGVTVSDRHELIGGSNTSDRYVCSLGRDAILNEDWKPTPPALGVMLQSALNQIGEAFKGGM